MKILYKKAYSVLKGIGWEVINPKRIYLKLKELTIVWKYKWKVIYRWAHRVKGKPHNLPAQLIISLTSYSARFETLHLTLKCLLTQTVTPDRVILWIAHSDKSALPNSVLSFEGCGLEVLYCDDLKSYKKIIPTLQIAPDVFIVTADDDVYYWPRWLEELTAAYSGDNKEVLCHRAHTIRLNDKGLPLPYNEWLLDIENTKASPLNFPTGIGGVMYPPAVFHPDVQAIEIFMEHCPKADDIWLYWMVCRNGGKSRKIGTKAMFKTWPDSQKSALWLENVSGGGNDLKIFWMLSQYGFTKSTHKDCSDNSSQI